MDATTATLPAHAEQMAALLAEAIDTGSLTLPVLPATAAKIKQEAINPTSNAKRMGRIIASDAALAARLLKMANSAIYAGLSEIRELDHAIGRLGAAMVVALAIGAVGKETFQSDDEEFQQLLDHQWRRSLYASSVCRLLASPLSLVPDEVFLAGLMHGAGAPILLEVIQGEIAAGRLERPEIPLVEAVIREYSPAAAARLLRKWRLPEMIVAAVEHQRDPEAAPEPHRLCARLLSFASEFSKDAADGHPTDIYVQHPLLAETGLEQTALERLLARAAREGREMARAF